MCTQRMKTTHFVLLSVVLVLYFAMGVHGKDGQLSTLSENTVRDGKKCGEDMYWELNDESTILTISGTGYMDNYTFFGSPWSGSRLSITNVVIGEGVLSIGNYAFYECNFLKDVQMPESLELIGRYAFYNCSLTHMKIGNNVKSVMGYAFSNCFYLVNFSIGRNLALIEDGVFNRCTKLASFDVDSENTKYSVINGVLFSDDNTVLVQYPQGKPDINYTIPDHVKSIGNYAFIQSTLTTVIFPDSVTSIGDFSFYASNKLLSVSLPDSIISIRKYAFYGCGSLETFKFSNKLERIDDYAFYYCNKLQSITLPKSLQYIGEMATNSESNYMESIDVEDGSEYFKSVDGVLFNHNLTELIQYPSGKINIDNYAIPDSVKIIRIAAFDNCKLMGVSIPSGVKELGESVFQNCYYLTSVVIPEGVESIGTDVFYGCESLGNVTIPESMKNIDDYAFSGCYELKSVFYQGLTPITISTALESHTSLTDVCTPPGYTSDTFCGATVTPSSETCKTYQSFFGPCTKGVCIDGVLAEVKWDNVTAWEQRTNDCEEYRCDREHGFVSWWNCNTSDEVSRVCANGQCITENNAINNDEDKRWSVELKMNNVTFNEVDESDILNILSNLTGISTMKIGTEVDDKGNVLRIIIYVRDETMANIVAKTVNDIKKEPNSSNEILQKAIDVQIHCHVVSLSNGYQTVVNLLMLLLLLIAIQ